MTDKSCFILVAVGAFMLLTSGLAVAQQSPWTKEDVYQQVSSEAARCEAYYTTAWKCAGNDGNTTLASKLEVARKKAAMLQYFIGRSAGMSDAALMATVDLAMQNALSATEKSCRNLIVLIQEDAEFCERLVESPEARINALRDGPQ